jgi:hypothetical protein
MTKAQEEKTNLDGKDKSQGDLVDGGTQCRLGARKKLGRTDYRNFKTTKEREVPPLPGQTRRALYHPLHGRQMAN